MVIALALLGALSTAVSATADQASPRKLALPALGNPAPQTTKKAMWGPSDFGGQSLFPVFRDLGVGIFETQIQWNGIALSRPSQPTDPNDPAYQWPAGLDQTIAQAGSNGIEVAVQIIGTPSWANGGKSGKWAPDNPQDFGDFAAAAARRYPAVHLWMIWGEPDRQPNFAPFTSAPPTGPLNHAQARAPRAYAQILDSAYGSLKSVDPANLVIGGMTYTAAGPGAIHTYQWIRYMRLPNGHRPRMDLYGHNPFGFRKPKLHSPPSPKGLVDFGDLGRLTQAVHHAFGKKVKLFLSEWGVPAGKKDSELGYSVSLPTQGKWVRSAFKIVRKMSSIYTLGWVHFVDNPALKSTQGLLDANGDPKPGYFAFKNG